MPFFLYKAFELIIVSMQDVYDFLSLFYEQIF